MGDFDRTFSKIQSLRRVVLPDGLMKELGMQVGDQVIIEHYNGKVMISPVKRTIKPITERL